MIMTTAPISSFCSLHNGQSLDADACPVLPFEAFRRGVCEAVADGAELIALFVDEQPARRLIAVLGRPAHGVLAMASAAIGEQYDSLTPDCPAAQAFEREIAEQWGIAPRNHPWLKPVRFAPGCRGEQAPIGQADFFRMHGDEVHEVAVGPVHAGIIEPGHFRFQCHGENVYHLEISLGYQHRGVERALCGGPNPRTIHYVETLAGDTTMGHAHAYCRAVESLAHARVPPRGQVLRGVAAELERVANHVGDLGALAGDIGFLPTQSYCGRIRGDVLNLTALVCGNRFGRGLLRPGGTAFDLDPATTETMLSRLRAIERDLQSAVELLWETPSVMARFDDTGRLPTDLCRRIGVVGLAARACGWERDVRSDYPYGIYRFTQIPISTWTSGDVFARAYVRRLEVQRSLKFIREQLESLPAGPVSVAIGPLAAGKMAVALVEGWRGRICHVYKTDDCGRFGLVKIVDPSFHNWFGLAMAMRDQPISDFPLCNKSFNLSYCGHDL